MTHPSSLIDQRIRELKGWRGETLARMRALILAAAPGITEEWKWDVPVWSHNGILCTGESYAKAVKLTFAHGASLPDPARLFNSSLKGNTRRAIDIPEGGSVDARAFKALVKAAVALNADTARKRTKKSPRTNAEPKSAAPKSAAPKPAPTKPAPVRLLSGGNPQVAMADGDAPVQAYIAALSGWQHTRAKWIDALIVKTLPDVRKAVKWNSPLYGVEGQGWFLSLHTFTRYLKYAFFFGASLRPPPPGRSKDKNTRYLDVHEDDALDEQQFARWVRQAAAIPGYLAPR